jgi:hypothetical protein
MPAGGSLTRAGFSLLADVGGQAVAGSRLRFPGGDDELFDDPVRAGGVHVLSWGCPNARVVQVGGGSSLADRYVLRGGTEPLFLVAS